MKYYSQYRSHDLFELQESLSGLSKFMEKPVFVPELFVLVRKRLDHDFFNMLTLMLAEVDGSKPGFHLLIKKKRKGEEARQDQADPDTLLEG